MKTRHPIGSRAFGGANGKERDGEGKPPSPHPTPPKSTLLLDYCCGCCVKVGGCKLRSLVYFFGCRWVVSDGLMLKNEQCGGSLVPVLGFTNSSRPRG